MIEQEIWKDIKGYEGLYQVSSLGRVKGLYRTIIRSNGRLQTFPEKILSPYVHDGKYLRVQLLNVGKGKAFKVHRLVAIAFLPNPDNKKEVNHKDLNKLNNRLDNLEWVTGEENIKHYLESDKYKNYLQTKLKT